MKSLMAIYSTKIHYKVINTVEIAVIKIVLIVRRSQMIKVL